MDRVERLAVRGPDGLAELLRRRPGVLVGRPPRTLAELGQRLDAYPSVLTACQTLTAPELQVLVAAAALGHVVSVVRLAELVDGDPRPHLEVLAGLDLLGDDGATVRFEPEVRRAVPDLLGLGAPFVEIAAALAHRSLRPLETAFDLPHASTKAASVEQLRHVYADPERLRARAERVPRPVLDALLERASDAGFGRVDDAGFEHWERAATLDRIGLELGLLVRDDGGGWVDQVVMPSEVAIALRGPDYRVAFHPEPPVVAWLPVTRVESDSAAAVAAFDAAATAVLDHVAVKPVPTVQAGGVGRRELQRLAKLTSLDVDTVLVVLELAAEAGLVDELGAVTVTGEFRAWRDAEPAERFVTLTEARWRFPGQAGDAPTAGGAARRALVGERCPDCRISRVALVEALRPDRGLSLVDAARLTGWHRPFAHHGDPSFPGHWADAARLGVVAQGAVTPVGVALRSGDTAALLAAARAALPASSTHAVFGSDLTVFVAGSPSSRVSGVLDACATRESGGGAVTWRLSTASVRAALDDGADLAVLRSSLQEIAADGSLPGAVDVLLDDVARVYGRAVVRAAAGVVVSDDELLLVQMRHDRKLAKLGLDAVAPTVLVASADARTTTMTLRAAGYLPEWTPSAVPAPVRVPAMSWRRQVAEIAEQATADPDVLARTLLAAGREPPASSATEGAIRTVNRHLTDDEVAVLADALDAGRRVQIVYESASGAVTERVVRPAELAHGHLRAWCELRRDEREFLVDRVLGVRPV